MSKIEGYNKDFEEFRKQKNVYLEMVRRNIDNQLKLKKPLESVTLSNWAYDKMEAHIRYGLDILKADEEYYICPRSHKGIEIKRANVPQMEEIVFNYRETVTDVQALLQMDKNAEMFNIKSGTLGAQALDDALKNVVKPKRK